MNINLEQSDIEQAIRQYIVKMGMTRPVDEITFTQNRKGGTSISANIELIDPEATPSKSKVVPMEAVVTEEKEEKTETESVEEVKETEPEPAEEEPAKESKSLFGSK